MSELRMQMIDNMQLSDSMHDAIHLLVLFYYKSLSYICQILQEW